MTLHLCSSVPVLNIYGLSCPPTSDLHLIAQDCVSQRLPFVPFVLTHSDLLAPASHAHASSFVAPDILLAGGDRNVHVYRWNGVAYAELALNATHPLAMLQRTPTSVMAIDVVCNADATRTTMVVACQDGMVRVATLPTDPEAAPIAGRTQDSWRDFYLDGPVSSASFFSPSTSTLCDVFRSRAAATRAIRDTPLHRLQQRATIDQRHPHNESSAPGARTRHRVSHEPEVHLLMANAVGFGAVYESATGARERMAACDATSPDISPTPLFHVSSLLSCAPVPSTLLPSPSLAATI